MKHFYFLKYLFLLTLGLSSAALNGQETFTFTSAGSDGNTGPTQVQINTAYSGTNLDGQVVINTQGIQEWTVPSSGPYRIQVVGATGGNQNEATLAVGHPANMNGEFMLIGGDVVKVLVGQKGFLGSTRPGWGGGGGTFVTRSDNSPLIVAGGSGSGHTDYTTSGLDTQNASLTTQGKNGSSGTGVWPDGMGAIGGSGGDGAGLNGDGTIGNASSYMPIAGLIHTIPQAFINGGVGDEFGGGFGGGGGVTNTYGGGAGGFSGGQGGVSGPYSGGGGGSFNSGDNQDNYLDTNDEFTMADGSVVITKLCTDAVVITEAPSKAVCDETIVTLTAMSINGGEISWDNGVTNGEPFEITSTTTFNATSTHPDDCGTSVTIIVLTNTADISNHPDSQDDVVEGTDVNFRITATGGSLEYRWRKNGVKLSNGGNITGAYLPVLSVNGVTDADEGDYDCVVYGSCVVLVSQKASLTVVGSGDDGTATAIDELDKAGISVYPNPSNGIFTIQLKDFTDRAIVSIFDFSGKTVYKKIADNDKISVDISEKPAGIYFIRLELNDRIIESKIVLK